MTNTKFRKRALLSSVAMLLVAMLALGSATFAWFVGNATVTAGTLKMQATAGAGVQIASDYDLRTVTSGSASEKQAAEVLLYSYGATLSDDTPFSLTPASPAANTAFSGYALKFGTGSGTGARAGEGALNASGISETSTFTLGGTGAVFYEDIYLRKTASDATVVNYAQVTITPTTHTGKTIEKGIKVALVTADSIIGIWQVNDDKTKVWTGTDTESTEDWTDKATKYFANGGVASGLGLSLTQDTRSGDNPVKVRMYVYLDGESVDTVSDNALVATELFSAIEVKFSKNVLS